MNIIIPMAGKGTRMRPHTLTVPKPLMPIAGKPIIERLIDELNNAFSIPIHSIGFVINELDKEIQNHLGEIAKKIGAEPKFFIQSSQKGTAHALFCAQELLEGPVVIAYADTLFMHSKPINSALSNSIWVKKVANPSSFGVVKCNGNGIITDFIEKPSVFVSDLAIIGVYCFQKGEQLKQALSRLLESGSQRNGEYELTSVLEMMKNEGVKFSTQEVDEWLDCGNVKATLNTNTRFLECLQRSENLISPTVKLDNSVIIPPVFLGDEVIVTNSVLGPYVSVSGHTTITDSRIQHSIIQSHSIIENANMCHSIMGNHVNFLGKSSTMSVGDYNTIAGL